MNAYDLLIANQDADCPAGNQALGHLVHELNRSPHAVAVAAAGPWPAAWPATRGFRTCGAAVITPGGTMFVITRDDGGLDVRGAAYSATVARIGQPLVAGVDLDSVPALVERGVPALRSALWAALDEWGNDIDRACRDSLLR